MGEVSTSGGDIAKSVFQIHGVDAGGTVVIRRRVGRARVLEFFADLPPCLVGMEACATAHQWARELKKLGHDTRLMPPTYVKAYVKRGKNDAADAAAICEAVTRPSMRFVPIKSVGQQSALMLHRTRDLLIRQRTQLINALRAHLAELGLVAAKGRQGLQQLIAAMAESSEARLSGGQVTHALPASPSWRNCTCFRARSTGSTNVSLRPIAPTLTANGSMPFQ